MEAALGHQGQQAQGLEADGLAAGVGAGDDQGVEGVSQLDVDGHGLFGIQQRMPGPPQVDGPVPANLRAHAVHLVAELAPGKDQVQMDQRVVVPLDILPVGRRFRGQLRQNAFDLLLLLGLQLDQLVVGLDNAHGLHEQRGAGGGNVVDQTRQIAFVLCLYRHHKATVPLGDDSLLQNLAVAGGGDDLLQNLAALGLGRPHMPPDIRQLRAGRVGDGVLVHDAALDLLLQKTVAMEGQKQVVDGRLFRGLVVEVLPGPAGGGQHPRDGQQLPGIQAAAPVRPVQGLRHRLHAGKRRASMEADHRPGGVGLVQQAQDLLRLRLRPDPQSPGLGLGADGLIAQQLQHSGQLQGTDGFVKQFAHIHSSSYNLSSLYKMLSILADFPPAGGSYRSPASGIPAPAVPPRRPPRHRTGASAPFPPA